MIKRLKKRKSLSSLKAGCLSDQAKCLDWRSRNATFACKLPPSLVAEVLAKLNTLLEP